MSQTPWNSINEGIVSAEENTLSLDEAFLSPCANCPTTPCCSALPLNNFQITNLIELDHARYVLNFDRILVGLSSSGEWGVYYRYPCRFLNQETFQCSVHGKPEQPQICKQYNPYSCWYKRVFTIGISSEFLQIDCQRMAFIESQITFDEGRNLIKVPDWPDLEVGIKALPAESIPIPTHPPASDQPMMTWQEMAVHPDKNKPSADGKDFCYEELSDPCTDCPAYCCQNLVFPRSIPGHIGSLDFFRFALGFPGIELGIADDEWSIIIKTNCRYFKDGRCSIFGRPERPLICKYYDAWQCTYKNHFGMPRPRGFMRVNLEHFHWLVERFRFDRDGNVVKLPKMEEIREYIEERWRDGAGMIAKPEVAP